MRTFVSVAAYSDPVLPFTLERAVATACAPQDLHFGIVDQTTLPAPDADSLAPAQVSYLRIDPVYARGPCWARALAMTLFAGEDWFFQIDSHMDFEEGWDEKLQQQALRLMEGRPGIAISSYPNAFVFEGGVPQRRPATDGVLVHVVKPGVNFDPSHPVLGFEAHPLDSEVAVPGIHPGAGCLFAPGTFVQAFPYDPWFYFHGEEQALGARLYTRGWDLFHMPHLPVYHLYNDPNSGAPPRPLHWDQGEDAQRAQSWWQLEERSRSRLASLLAGEDLGIYSLGRVRSMADYARFSGIDYAARTIAPIAYERAARVAQA